LFGAVPGGIIRLSPASTREAQRPMDRQVDSIASPALEAGPDAPAKKRHGCFYYGCLTSIAAVLLVGAGFFFLFQYGKTSVTPVVEEFLSAAEGGDYDRAYAMVSDEWRRKTSRDEFPALFKMVHDTLGARRSLSMRGINLQTTTSGTTARAEYLAEYDKGEADVTVNLKKYDGEWRVIGVFYNSPKLADGLKCPNCGAANPLDAKFCAKCGKPLRPVEEKAPAEEQKLDRRSALPTRKGLAI
jgi:ribosomal protein L40E